MTDSLPLQRRADEKFFQKEEFGKIIEYVQTHHQRAKLQQEEDGLVFSVGDVLSARAALQVFEAIGI